MGLFFLGFQLCQGFGKGVGLVELLGLGVVLVDLHEGGPVVAERGKAALDGLAFLGDEGAAV